MDTNCDCANVDGQHEPLCATVHTDRAAFTATLRKIREHRLATTTIICDPWTTIDPSLEHLVDAGLVAPF